MEDIGEERLVEPDRAKRSRLIAQHELEDLESRPSRRTNSRAHHFPDDRRRQPGAEGSNRLKAAAVFVSDGEPVEEILDGDEADPLQIRGAARPDAFQVLKRRLKRI
jgi:hypothetical protein